MSKPDSKKKKKDRFPLSVVFPSDPNEDKEDTRPIERRKKPRISFRWS